MPYYQVVVGLGRIRLWERLDSATQDPLGDEAHYRSGNEELILLAQRLASTHANSRYDMSAYQRSLFELGDRPNGPRAFGKEAARR